jgi:hypothetical protein
MGGEDSWSHGVSDEPDFDPQDDGLRAAIERAETGHDKNGMVGSIEPCCLDAIEAGVRAWLASVEPSEAEIEAAGNEIWNRTRDLRTHAECDEIARAALVAARRVTQEQTDE